jgi:8-oxo-dGTP diphosphatase
MNFPYFLRLFYDKIISTVEVPMTTESFLSLFAAKEAKRFKLKVGVFVVLMEQEKILLLRRFQTGIADGKYVLPMGGHDGKEPLSQTLIREAKEEINIDVAPENLSVCHVMHRFHPMPEGLSFEQIDIYFRVKRYEGIIQNNEPERCDEVAFYPLSALPPTTEGFICHALKCVQRGEVFSEFGFD